MYTLVREGTIDGKAGLPLGDVSIGESGLEVGVGIGPTGLGDVAAARIGSKVDNDTRGGSGLSV